MEAENTVAPETLKITRVWRYKPGTLGYFNVLMGVDSLDDIDFAYEIPNLARCRANCSGA